MGENASGHHGGFRAGDGRLLDSGGDPRDGQGAWVARVVSHTEDRSFSILGLSSGISGPPGGWVRTRWAASVRAKRRWDELLEE